MELNQYNFQAQCGTPGQGEGTDMVYPSLAYLGLARLVRGPRAKPEQHFPPHI